MSTVQIRNIKKSTPLNCNFWLKNNSGHLVLQKDNFHNLSTALINTRLIKTRLIKSLIKHRPFTHARGTYFLLAILQIERLVGGSARICTLCKLEKLYAKMDHPQGNIKNSMQFYLNMTVIFLGWSALCPLKFVEQSNETLISDFCFILPSSWLINIGSKLGLGNKWKCLCILKSFCLNDVILWRHMTAWQLWCRKMS